MTTSQWIVANELGNSTDMQRFVASINNHPHAILHPVGIKDCLTPDWTPNAPRNIPTIFYGPTNFVQRMSDQQQYHPGVYGNPTLYDYEHLIQHIPSTWLMNDPTDTHIGTPMEIIDVLDKIQYTDIFFKPCADTKLIIGQVTNADTIRQTCQHIHNGKIEGGDANTKLLIGPAFNIEVEYRIFVINGAVVAASEYAPQRRSAWPLPPNIAQYAQQVIERWNPSPAYVLDIACSNGRPYIMEIQNFHSAGFYESNTDAIVHALHTMITKDPR